MEPSREVTVEIGLRPNDVYTPFQWNRGNLIRWVLALFLAWLFYERLHDGSEALLSFPEGPSIRAIAIVLAVFIVLGLLLFPYLRVLANFRKYSAMKRPHRVTFRVDGFKIASDVANSECKWASVDKAFETTTLFVLPYSSRVFPLLFSTVPP